MNLCERAQASIGRSTQRALAAVPRVQLCLMRLTLTARGEILQCGRLSSHCRASATALHADDGTFVTVSAPTQPQCSSCLACHGPVGCGRGAAAPRRRGERPRRMERRQPSDSFGVEKDSSRTTLIEAVCDLAASCPRFSEDTDETDRDRITQRHTMLRACQLGERATLHLPSKRRVCISPGNPVLACLVPVRRAVGQISDS